MENEYNRISKKEVHNGMAVIVQGHEVTLLFADKPNTQVANMIKQALLGIYLPERK